MKPCGPYKSQKSGRIITINKVGRILLGVHYYLPGNCKRQSRNPEYFRSESYATKVYIMNFKSLHFNTRSTILQPQVKIALVRRGRKIGQISASKLKILQCI